MTEVSKIQSNTVNIMKKSYALILLYVSRAKEDSSHSRSGMLEVGTTELSNSFLFGHFSVNT
jgi:hypothetical protein